MRSGGREGDLKGSRRALEASFESASPHLGIWGIGRTDRFSDQALEAGAVAARSIASATIRRRASVERGMVDWMPSP